VEDVVRKSKFVSWQGLVALACSVLIVFEPIVSAQDGFFPRGESSNVPVSIAVAKLTGTAERNGQPLLNGSVVTSGDSLRTHANSALLLAAAPGERLWIGPNTNVRLVKNKASVGVALGRGTLAFETSGHMRVTVDNHEGLGLRSQPDSSVLAELSLVNDQQLQVRVQQGFLELTEGDRSVVLQPERSGGSAAIDTHSGAALTAKRIGDEGQGAITAPTGSVNGTVVDAQLFVVSGAKLTLTNTAGQILTATSNAEGKFTFSDVAPGTYTLKVSKSGLKPYELKDVVVRSGNESSLFVHLAGAGGQGGSNNNILIWVLVGGAAAGGIGAYLATRGSSSNTNSPSTVP
jgi:hypothetical protein